jgi:hypothetical protein
MVTRLRASQSGVRIPVRTSDFILLQNFQTGFGPLTGYRTLSRGKSGSVIKLTTHFRLVLRLISGAIPLRLYACVACIGTNLPLPLICQVPLQMHININNDIRCCHWGKNAAGLWEPVWKLNRQSKPSRKESWQHSKYMCQQVLSVMSIRESRFDPGLLMKSFVFNTFLNFLL